MTAQRGFTLLETTIAIALTCAAIAGGCVAVAHATRATALAGVRATLTGDALDVLADLRAATAYDARALARVAGCRYTATVVRDGGTLSITVAVDRERTGVPTIAHVTVSDANGVTATADRELYAEAPAPGSVVAVPSPQAVVP